MDSKRAVAAEEEDSMPGGAIAGVVGCSAPGGRTSCSGAMGFVGWELEVVFGKGGNLAGC